MEQLKMNKIPSYKTMFKPARDQVRDLINSNPELDDDDENGESDTAEDNNEKEEGNEKDETSTNGNVAINITKKN